MSIVTLAQLVAPVTFDEALTEELAIAAGLGLPTTAWQPIDPLRTILSTQAQVTANYSVTVNQIAQGATATYAAIIPAPTGSQYADANGFLTTWMDLRALDQYNITRIQATFAPGNVTIVNSTAGTFGSPYAPGTLHFSYVGGSNPTFSNTGTVSITPSGDTTIAIQADAAFPGSLGNVPQGATLNMLTPLVGVTVSALAAAIIGNTQETNAHLLARGQAKLGSLSPNGAASAYAYEAESLPPFNSVLADGSTFTKPTTSQPYGVTSAITRCLPVLQIGSGIIYVYVANAAGAPTGCAGNPITAVTNVTNPQITTANNHGLAAGNWVIIKGVQGAIGLNNTTTGVPAWQVLTTPTGTTFTISAPAPGAYTSEGTVDGGDLGMVDAVIQALTVPVGQIAMVKPATTTTILVTCTVYISQSNAVPVATAQANISAALQNYMANVPIGGYALDGGTNVVPSSEILVVIANANAGTKSVAMSAPSPVVDTVLASGAVPVLSGSSTYSIQFV